jgi:hypothetical protein
MHPQNTECRQHAGEVTNITARPVPPRFLGPSEARGMAA